MHKSIICRGRVYRATSPYIKILIFILSIDHNVLNSAIKNCAKIIKSDRSYRSVMLESVDKTATDIVFVNKSIGCYTFLFHRLV